MSSCECTKIATSCWPTINRKMLEPTKKDTPRPKTKEKTQWDGRRVKSNPLPTMWEIHKLENNITKEALPLLWRLWALCRASQPRYPAKGLGVSTEADFEGQRDLITGLPQDQGKQRLHSSRAHTKKSCVPQDPGERSSDPTGDWTTSTC